MTVSTLRPTSTVKNGTSSIGGGAGSRHAAVSDDSDSTYVDITGAFPNTTTGFGFTLPSPPSGAVIHAAVPRARVQCTGSPGWPVVSMGSLLANDGQYSATAVNVGPDIQNILLNGMFGDGTGLQLAIWKNGSGTSATVRLIEVYVDLYYTIKPVTTASGPTGTLTEMNRPLIEFATVFDPDNLLGPRATQVRVFTDAVYGGGGFDPATSLAAWETDAPTIFGPVLISPVQTGVLVNDTYRAYVREEDPVSGWSDWDYVEFTVNVSPPDVPALALTDQPSSGGRVKVDVTPDNSPVATDGVLIERSIDAGTTWSEVAEIAGGSASTTYDYFAPSGVSTQYRVRAWNDTVSDRLYSAAATASVTPTGGWWLKHPTDPSLNFSLDTRPRRVREIDSLTAQVRQTELQPLGRDDAVVYIESDGPDRGTLTVMVEDMLEWDTFRALVADRVPLYLAGRAADKWRDRWVVLGDREASRVIEKIYTSPFDLSVSWVEVAEP